MSDQGHAIGLPPDGPYRSGPAQPYGSSQPYESASYSYGSSQPYESAPHAYATGQPLEVSEPSELDELVSAHAQGRQLAESGDLTAARTLLEEALQRGELRFGPDDARLAPLMVDLATIARRLGNLTEAHNQLQRAHGIIVATVGGEHATALSIEGRLAAVVYRLGEPTDGYDRHLADAGARILGADHPAVQGARQRLASRTAAPPPLPAGPTPAPWIEQAQAFAAPVEFAPAATPPVQQTPALTPLAEQTPVFAPPAAQPMPTRGPTEHLPAIFGSVEDAASVHLPTEQVPAITGTTYAPVADGIYQPIDGPDATAGGWHESGSEEPTVRRRSSNNPAVALVIALCAVVLVGGVFVALQLLRTDGGPTAPDPVTGSTPSVATSPAPTGVTIKDDGGSVTITWIDPSSGTVQFLVSGARAGNALAVLTSVPAGRTVATIYGINANYNYCFSVSAVWSGDNIQESIRACTSRTLPTGSTSVRPT